MSFKKNSDLSRLVALILAGALALSACGDGGDENEDPGGGSPTTTATDGQDY